MDKIKILVAQHKEAEVFHNEVYTPIQVGKSISKVDLGILGDDTGDNISELNPYFCELTAQYWAWKNLHNVEYIGLCHYRRYFEKEFTKDNVEQLMGGCDVVLTRSNVGCNDCLQGISNFNTPEDATIFYLYLTKRFPYNVSDIEEMMLHRNWGNPFNMFVCKKSLFDDFCQWQFPILKDLFEIIEPQKIRYTRHKRLIGYFGEDMWRIYAKIHHLKIKEMKIVDMVGDRLAVETPISYMKHFVHNTLNSAWFRIHLRSHYEPASDTSVMVGLKADGILKKIDAAVSKQMLTGGGFVERRLCR